MTFYKKSIFFVLKLLICHLFIYFRCCTNICIIYIIFNILRPFQVVRSNRNFALPEHLCFKFFDNHELVYWNCWSCYTLLTYGNYKFYYRVIQDLFHLKFLNYLESNGKYRYLNITKIWTKYTSIYYCFWMQEINFIRRKKTFTFTIKI